VQLSDPFLRLALRLLDSEDQRLQMDSLDGRNENSLDGHNEMVGSLLSTFAPRPLPEVPSSSGYLCGGPCRYVALRLAAAGLAGLVISGSPSLTF
jgi:hypothetical protein